MLGSIGPEPNNLNILFFRKLTRNDGSPVIFAKIEELQKELGCEPGRLVYNRKRVESQKQGNILAEK